ncbi:carboxy terminal-processing peptidase [Deltaproteobacteria bacterium TL4]
MKYRSFFVAVLFLGMSVLPLTSQAEEPPLSGSIVKRIVEQFVDMHYSQSQVDDSISEKTLDSFLNSFDPGHYYFLDSDIQEYKKYKDQLDDLIKQGNVEIALKIFTRFKTRLSERLQMMEEFVKENFDFNKDGVWLIDRKNAPYPKTTEEAREIWRLKIKFDLLHMVRTGSTLEESKDRLLKRVRSVWKDYSKYTDNDTISMYLNALTSAYDPHSSYLSAQELKNFDISIKLSLEGIGAVLRWEDGYTVVNSIVPGGAAYRDGRLKVNDRVIAVSQGDNVFENVVDVRLANVVNLIRGKRGTKVRLQLLRKTEKGDATLVIDITRDQIVLKDGEAQSKLFDPVPPLTSKNEKEIPVSKEVAGAKEKAATTPENEVFYAPAQYKLGVIRLPSFYVDFNGRRENPQNYKSSSRDVKNHLLQFNQDKVDGVILDLRGNGGGGLDEAISMAGLFIGKQPVVIVRQSGGSRRFIHRSRQPSVYEGPLLVMLDSYSASASEILAGALRDYHRAILVGDKTTFGKGTVQNIAQLPTGFGALKVTIAQFYRVNGWSTQNKGVESDIVLKSIMNEREVGESTLPNALPWKAISPANYRPLGDLKTYLPELQANSAKRLEKSEYFQKVEKNIHKYLTEIKSRTHTSILQVQEDYKQQEAEDKKSGNKEEAVSKNDEAPKEEDAGIYRDDYLQEGMLILEDYLRLSQLGKAAKIGSVIKKT